MKNNSDLQRNGHNHFNYHLLTGEDISWLSSVVGGVVTAPLYCLLGLLQANHIVRFNEQATFPIISFVYDYDNITILILSLGY